MCKSRIWIVGSPHTRTILKRAPVGTKSKLVSEPRDELRIGDSPRDGVNGTTKLDSTTVFDDGAIDTLKGSSPPTPNIADLDWLFKSTGDLMAALVAGEF